jgi:hypothetical protein
MLVVGHRVMERDPEGPSRPLREQPEEGEDLVDALMVTRDRVAAGLMEDRIVSKHLSEGFGVASGEGVVGSAEFLAGWAMAATSCPRGVATLVSTALGASDLSTADALSCRPPRATCDR